MGLVRLDVGVEARVGRVPQVAEARGGNAITTLERGLGAGLAKVAIEVLFACQVSAPGRVAHRAVVQGAEHASPAGVGAGLQARVARGWAAHLDRGLTGDAARVDRGTNDPPAGLASSPESATCVARVLDDLDDADAVRI